MMILTRAKQELLRLLKQVTWLIIALSAWSTYLFIFLLRYFKFTKSITEFK